MSARSRYLAAISPRESDATSPAETGTNAKKFELSSPSAVATRQRKSFAQNNAASTSAAAPPPPPPGPPPKKLPKRRDAKPSDSLKEPIAFRSSQSSSNSQNEWTPSFNSQSCYQMERSASASSKGSNPLSSPKFQTSSSFGKSGSYLSSSSSSSRAALNSPQGQAGSTFKSQQQQQQPDSPSRSQAGEVWSPKDEIQSGNVARFKQMLWGGENAGPSPKEGKMVSPMDGRGKSSVGTVAKRFDTANEKHVKDDASVDTESASQSQKHSLAGVSNNNTSQSKTPPNSNQRAPPSTPPRPSTSRAYNNYNNSNRRVSTRSPSPPKYKLNAPPSLKLGKGNGLSINTGGGIAPPSRVFHPRPEKSPVKDRSANPSPLRQRASGLNLAPIDTSFGNGDGKSKKSDNETSLPPSGSRKNEAETLSLLGASPTPTNAGDAHKFGFDSENKEVSLSTGSANVSEGHFLPTINASVTNSSIEAGPPTLPDNPSGVTTVTSFKRPNAKVGIVFTRRSRSSPDICVISKIMPDSIFSAHEQRYARDEGTLKGAEVIAVNGIPVREARHAAELVAGCAEEVRLTIRRVGSSLGPVSVAESKVEEKRVEPIVEKQEPVEIQPPKELAPLPQSVPPSMNDMDDGPNKTISFDEESEISVKTEEEENKSGVEEVQERQFLNDEPDWSDQKSTKTQDIIERRRQIAKSMIISTEMVDDPIPSPDGCFSSEFKPDFHPNDEMENTSQAVSAASQSSSRPSSSRNSGSASAIERRRLAAMEMYQSREMVVDNVDDTRLGTIDAISPRETVDPLSSYKSNNDPFGDNASIATTNITTSSEVTQRMGSNNIKDFFSDAFSPTNAVPLQSPQAQRRKERAMQRNSRSNSFSRPESVSQSTTPTNENSPTATRSPISNTEAPPRNKDFSSNLSAHSASQIRKNKTDDESLAAASVTASSVAASTAATSTAAISETSGESRSSRSLFGTKKKKQPLGNAVTQTVPPKKKSSIFGVANLIRKVNSRKGKFSKKGQLMEDSSLFNDKEMSDKPPASASQENLNFEPEPKQAEHTIGSITSTGEHANLPASEKKSDGMPPGEAIPQSSTWGSARFFDDAFASSPFNDPALSGNDAFGFPESAVASEDQTFFDDSPDAWGEPSSLKSSLRPVDFTPRKNNLNFHGNAFDNDAMSYDASEMSEVTNPTFVTRPDPEGDETGRTAIPKKSSAHIRQPSQGSSSQEPSESAVPLLGVSSYDSLDGAEGEKPGEESESQKENKGGGNDTGTVPLNRSNKLPPSYNENPADTDNDPPLASLDDFSDDENTSLDNSKDSKQSAPSFAKSRIMEKYSKGGRLRKPSRSDNRSKQPSPPSQTLQDNHTMSHETSNTSLTTASITTKTIASRSIQPEVATGMHSKQISSFSPQRQVAARVGSDSSSIDSASARRNERIQRTNRLNQEKREAMASKEATISSRTESPNPTSLVYRRRGGRMPSSQHSLELDQSLDNSFSSESKNRRKDSYSVKKKAAPSLIDDPSYYNMEEKLMKIKDPVQRAGVRLLWAAAIPIQTQSRRFLARQIAIKRMCGILTIQAFVRRWLAERDLEIAIWSIIQIQAVFRGWYARDSLEDNHYCATQIQRVVRSYLATMHVFEDLYSITIVQSVVRMHLAINKAVDRLSSVIAIQAWYRGVSTRYEVGEREYSAIAIQSNWRRYLCQMSYQFDIIDIIIVQSIIRRRNAIKQRKSLCAVKIQSAWRSYDCSMTFVHTLADIITVQSVIRRWCTIRCLAAVRIQCLVRVFISRKHFSELRAMNYLVTRHVSATRIQSSWRTYCAQVQMLIDIVNIIVIQSLWRRRTVLRLYRPLLNRIKLAKERTANKAAIKIQSAWRSFIVFSSYLILRYENQAATTIQSYWRRYYQYTNYSIIYYEIIKIQAAVRGHQERSWRMLEEDCATIIQAATRRFLERKDIHNEGMIDILIAAASNSLRMRNAAKKLQQWWLDDMWARREKEAALIIERFFINVKYEVEAEVAALKKKKKEKRRLRKLKQSDEWILERAWLNTMEEPSFDQKDIRPSVPTGADNIYTQSNRFIKSVEEDRQTDISGLTDSPGTRHFSRKFQRTQMELEEDASLEDAFHASESRYAQTQEEAYRRRHGYTGKTSTASGSNRQFNRKAAM